VRTASTTAPCNAPRHKPRPTAPQPPTPPRTLRTRATPTVVLTTARTPARSTSTTSSRPRPRNQADKRGRRGHGPRRPRFPGVLLVKATSARPLDRLTRARPRALSRRTCDLGVFMGRSALGAGEHGWPERLGVSCPCLTLRVARLTACGRPGKRHDPTSRKRLATRGSGTGARMFTPDQPEQQSITVSELFARYHDVIRKHVQGVVNTSAENVEDACMFAWTKLLSIEHDQIIDARSWLTTVAIHEAFKLDRQPRASDPAAGHHRRRSPRRRRPARRAAASAAAGRRGRRRKGREPLSPPGADSRPARRRVHLRGDLGSDG
jgi:hypothetical protein